MAVAPPPRVPADRDSWLSLTPEVIAALPEAPAVFEVANLVRTILYIERAQGKLREKLTALWQDPVKLPIRPGGHFFRYELTSKEEEVLQARLTAYRTKHQGQLPPINRDAGPALRVAARNVA